MGNTASKKKRKSTSELYTSSSTASPCSTPEFAEVKAEPTSNSYGMLGKQIIDVIENKEFIPKQWCELYQENIASASKPSIKGSLLDRYPGNSFVYEHSRVKLQPGELYINANYLLEQTYIASQAPLPDTFGDFWLMVWQQNTPVIVMLTKLQESNRIKADKYWPTKKHPKIEFTSQSDQEFLVQWIETQKSDAFTCRKFLLIDKLSEEERSIVQIQFTGWPDHGAPSDVQSFVSLLEEIGVQYQSSITSNSAEDKKPPLLIHCSAGVGRTGTLITIHHELIKAGEHFRSHYSEHFSQESSQDQSIEEKTQFLRDFLLDQHEFTVIETIYNLRKERKTMVQAQEQLYFCYYFIATILSSEEENIHLLQSLLSVFYETT